MVYCDTDSIVYINSPDGYNVRSCDMLGEWEDECATKEHKINPINYFVALAPKSYGYKTMYGEGDIKCKGISLRCAPTTAISMLSLLLAEILSSARRALV